MLIVMPLGYGNKEVIANGWAGLRHTGVCQDSIQKFRDVLLQEIIPLVEETYRVEADHDARAIAGLSMGGTQSLFIGLNAPERFAWIGAFSCGGLDANFEKAYPAMNETFNAQSCLLWIACGQQDGLIGLNRKLVEWLKAKGVQLTWLETSGGHSFTVRRRYLAELAPLLFQNNPRPERGSVFSRKKLDATSSHEERMKALTPAYSKQIVEPPLSSGGEPSDFAYGFIWLRSFHHPISVRIRKSGSSTVLHAVELDGAGGYAWGKMAREVNKELSPAELETVTAKLDKIGFWQMATHDNSSALRIDGATWILEGSQNSRYHVVERWSPKSGEFRETCLFFLRLADLVPADRIY